MLRRFVPLFDRVLVQRAEVATKTKAGILIPEASQKKELTATVVAVGPGARTEVMVTKSALLALKTNSFPPSDICC